MDAFKLFDPEAKGFLALSDLKSSIARLLNMSNKDVADSLLIFKRHDLDQDGKITYSEFCELFMPQN